MVVYWLYQKSWDLELIYFLQTILILSVDFVDWNSVHCNCINGVILSDFGVEDVSLEIVLSKLFRSKIIKNNLGFALFLLPKQWVWLKLIRHSQTENTVIRIQFQMSKVFSPFNLSFFCVFLIFIFEERGPTNQVFLTILSLRIFLPDNESQCFFLTNYDWIWLNCVLWLVHGFFSNFTVLFKIIDLKFVVFFNMAFIFFFATGCGFQQENNLIFI